jgi:DNA-binding SARP family transcriptional activator
VRRSVGGTFPAAALRLIGRFAVLKSGRLLTKADIGSRKARLLLALLAVDRGSLVRIGRITDVLWYASPPRDPAHNVATMVSRIRKALGDGCVVGDRAGYQLGDTVHVDLYDAAALVDMAEAASVRHAPAAALAAAERALRIVEGGGVLDEEPYAVWAEPARAEHGLILRRARRSLAESALRLDDHGTARLAAERAVAADGLDEIACRLLMRAHSAAGEPARALTAYQRLRAKLADELGVDPAVATQDLHVAILQGQVPRDSDPPVHNRSWRPFRDRSAPGPSAR